MQGSFVLENKRGETVRTLKVDVPTLFLVYRKDNRRVEVLGDTKHLVEDEIPFDLLQTVSAQDVKNHPVAIEKAGTLRWIPQVEKLSPLSEVIGEESGHFRRALKYTAGIMVGLLLLILIVGHFAQKEIPAEEPQRLVKIVPRSEVAPIVNPITHKQPLVQKIAHAKVKKHAVQKVTQHNVRKQTHAPRQVAINQMGALSILGNSTNKKSRGGLNVDAIHTTAGPGLGGTAGSGGVQTALYSQGLVAAPLGPQGHAGGAGGYGTHGRGGGQAGYGKISLTGSSSAFFQPVEREAIVEGGLDREQIAEVIQRHLGQIRFCYEQGLQEKPQLNGRVAIRFYINGGGFVNTAAVSNTSLHANDVESCIVGHLKSWKFPEPRGGVVVKVTYPFVLKRVTQQS